MSIYTHDPNQPGASSSSPFLAGPSAPQSASTIGNDGGNGHSSGSQGPGGAGGGEDDDGDAGGKKKKAGKRRKVNHACLYCRRSHMTCDEGRPCQRWCAFLYLLFPVRRSNRKCLDSIKREIGHLCHDERRPSKSEKQPSAPPVQMPAQTQQTQQQPQLVMPRTCFVDVLSCIRCIFLRRTGSSPSLETTRLLSLHFFLFSRVVQKDGHDATHDAYDILPHLCYTC